MRVLGFREIETDKIAYFGAICMGLSLGGIRISMAVSNILTVVAGLCMFWYLYKTKCNSFKTLSSWYWMPIVIFGVCLIPALVCSEELRLALRYYGNNVFYRPLGYFVFVLMLRDKPQHVKQALLVAMGLFGVEALYSCYMHSIGLDLRASGFNSDQPTSPFTTCICIYMACSIIFALDEAFAGKWRYFGVVMFMLSWVALLANDCRTGYVTVAFLIVLLSGKYVYQSRQKLLLVGLFVMVIGSFFCFHPHYRARLFSIGNTTTDMSNFARIELWKDSYAMWKRHPVVGVGLRSWGKVYEREYYIDSAIRRKIGICYAHPHNNYFLMLAEGGVFGFIGLMSLLGSLAIGVIKKIRTNFNAYWMMSLGVLLSYIVCGFFDSILWFSTPNRTFWIMLGMMFALADGSMTMKTENRSLSGGVLKYRLKSRLLKIYSCVWMWLLRCRLMIQNLDTETKCFDYKELPVWKASLDFVNAIDEVLEKCCDINSLEKLVEIQGMACALLTDIVVGCSFSSVEEYKIMLINVKRKSLLIRAKLLICERTGYLDKKRECELMDVIAMIDQNIADMQDNLGGVVAQKQ